MCIHWIGCVSLRILRRLYSVTPLPSVIQSLGLNCSSVSPFQNNSVLISGHTSLCAQCLLRMSAGFILPLTNEYTYSPVAAPHIRNCNDTCLLCSLDCGSDDPSTMVLLSPNSIDSPLIRTPRYCSVILLLCICSIAVLAAVLSDPYVAVLRIDSWL